MRIENELLRLGLRTMLLPVRERPEIGCGVGLEALVPSGEPFG